MAQLRIGKKPVIDRLKASVTKVEAEVAAEVRTVEKTVIQYVDREVQIIKEVPVEVIRHVEVPVERIVEVVKHVEVPVIQRVETIVEKIIEKPVEVIKEVPAFFDRLVVRYRIPNHVWMIVAVETLLLVSLICHELGRMK